MKKVGYYYDDIFLMHEPPPGHPESPRRLIAINDSLWHSPFWDGLVKLMPRRAATDEILTVHRKSYYDALSHFTGHFDADTYVSTHSVDAAHMAAGAVADAIEKCGTGEIERAFCAVRPPGHHAEAGSAMGFCLFNNVAVGARHAQRVGFQKVFIVDFDVHHGNGTQHMFEEDDTVFYFSTHQHPHYPGTGRASERGRGKGLGFTCNIPMEAGDGDEEFLHVYEGILPGLVEEFRPDLLLVSAGYDIHIRDPLAGLRVSSDGIRAVVRSVLRCAGNAPAVFSLEGGYHLASLGEAVTITMEELLYCN